jgi:meromycolic acid enoyl-[acyl-carrier-protein] reductase
VLHAVAFAPDTALGGNFLTASVVGRRDGGARVDVLAGRARTRARGPARRGDEPSIVGLDFDATVAWPGYDWMGVAKAGLESASRYLARDLGPRGIRVNLVAAGPLHTIAAHGIAGFETFEPVWQERAPLGWDARDATPVARTVCALLSTWMPGVTGELVHCDGGVHAMGAGMPVATGAGDDAGTGAGEVSPSTS